MNCTSTVIINRAVPGSGKTTMTRQITAELSKHDISWAVHSTDEFFMHNNRYMFDIDKLEEYHKRNLSNFTASIRNRTEVVICDNINIAPWQTSPYTDAARKNGYQILLITFEPRELAAHIASQQVTEEKPDAHNVPEKELKRFILEYYLFNPLLDVRTKINPFIHKNYKWDSNLKKRIPAEGHSPHFDYDKLIVIYPDEYNEMKQIIGKKVLENIKI